MKTILRGYLFSALVPLALTAPTVLADDFSACIERLRPQAVKLGVSAATFDRYAAALQPDPSVLELLDAQPEFKTPIWDYLAALVDQERIDDGRAMLEKWRDTLNRIEARYGVDPATVIAVWGVESDYGRQLGRRPLPVSLGTLSCMGRRQAYFGNEFLILLKIIDQGHLPAERLTGSWAGAFGQTQFMPSTFLRLAVDFDGDGCRDLVDSVPDALASAANYLAEGGWKRNETWGLEVILPAGFDASVAGRRNKLPLSEWIARGVKSADHRPLAAGGADHALLLPAGPEGPAFLVGRNFDAIYGYNAAESYALAIVELADRLRGDGGFKTPWPTDDPGLSRAGRRELQKLLIARGHDIGKPDGMIGEKTRRAVAEEQRKLGREPDGRASEKILAALSGGLVAADAAARDGENAHVAERGEGNLDRVMTDR